MTVRLMKVAQAMQQLLQEGRRTVDWHDAISCLFKLYLDPQVPDTSLSGQAAALCRWPPQLQQYQVMQSSPQHVRLQGQGGDMTQ